jgi:hypothetical protein
MVVAPTVGSSPIAIWLPVASRQKWARGIKDAQFTVSWKQLAPPRVMVSE